MAKIGLNNLWYAHLTESGNTATYGGALSFGKAISCNVSISNNSAALYADDVLAESDTSFQGGTVTLGVDDDRDAVFADVLGHSINASGKITRNSGDVAPYVALGRILVKLVGNVKLYKAEILYKVKFSEPSAEENTRGESVEFSTPEIEGVVSTLNNGDWSDAQTFTTHEDAKDYIFSVLGSPISYVYTKVTPVGTEDPSEEGWFIKNGSEYIRALDTEVVEDREYYSRSQA